MLIKKTTRSQNTQKIVFLNYAVIVKQKKNYALNSTRTRWKPLLGAFERVSRDRKAVPSAVVLLCACPRAGVGMVQLKFSENLGGLSF